MSTQTVDGVGSVNTLPSVTALADGGYTVTWTNVTTTDYTKNSTGADVKLVIVNGDGTIRGANETHSPTAAYKNGTGTLIGNDGVNTLDGRNGAKTMIGGKDNDNIIIKDTNFDKIDGGAGSDILIWAKAADLDLGSILNKVTNIETIQIGDNNYSTLTVSIDAILSMTSNNTLIVMGDQTDKVSIVNSSEWVNG